MTTTLANQLPPYQFDVMTPTLSLLREQHRESEVEIVPPCKRKPTVCGKIRTAENWRLVAHSDQRRLIAHSQERRCRNLQDQKQILNRSVGYPCTNSLTKILRLSEVERRKVSILTQKRHRRS